MAQVQAADAGAALNNSDFLSQLLKIVQDIFQAYTNFTNQMMQPIIDFFQNPVGNTIDLITGLLTNPGPTLVQYGPFLMALAYQAISWVGATLTYPQLLLQPLLAIGLAVAVPYLKQILDLLNFPPYVPGEAAAVPAQAPAPRADVQNPIPVATVAPTVPSAPATSVTSVPGGTAPGVGSAVAAGAPMVPYAVAGGDPGPGASPTLREGTSAKAPASDIAASAAAAAAASSLAKRKARRKRGASVKERGYADAYMDYEPEPDAPEPAPRPETRVSASSRGAGAMGFGGTVGDRDVTDQTQAAGLTQLPDDAYGGGPVDPMLPGNWHSEGGSHS
jgi:hypothetical protein